MNRKWLSFVLGLTFSLCLFQSPASGQELEMPGEDPTFIHKNVSDINKSSSSPTSVAEQPFSVDSSMHAAGHSSMNSSGYVYNPILGSHLRARYSTQSYGQDRGNFDLGTMKIWDQGEAVTFLDGQVTLNEESHVGYNLGLGYRWMTLPLFPFSADDEKIMGVSIWSDGQGAGGDNFFPQIGGSFEMLGDRVDFRANAYLPLGPESQDRDFKATGDLFYTENNIADKLIGIRDTALSVGELELAGRIADLEAWVFGGIYGISGGEVDEVGSKIGLRGYATPDLALSVSLMNDNYFDTNAVFSATWFIGRTRRENCPTGQLRDRFREPVIRNDYIAIAQSEVIAATNALTDADDELIRVVHIDSTAADGGDGTFENPYNMLADAEGTGSLEGDNILVHAGSTFTNDSITLQDNQRLLAEGLFNDNDPLTIDTNVDHTVTVLGGNEVSLPETATDAFETASATVTNDGTIDSAIILADSNEVNNLVITGGSHAITSVLFDGTTSPPTGGAGDAILQNLTISDTTDNAIELAMGFRQDDSTDPATNTLEMDIDIDNVFLSDIGGDFGILIDGDDDDFGEDNGVTVNESIDINNLQITDGTGVGLGIQNLTESTATTVITDYTYNGDSAGTGATGTGAFYFDQVDGTVIVNGDTTVSGVAAGGIGIEVTSSPATFNFANTVEMSNIDGNGIVIGNDADPTEEDIPDFTYNGSLATNVGAGNSVVLQNLDDGSVEFTFEDGLDDNGSGIDIDNVDGTTVRFSTSDLNEVNTITTTADNDHAITIANVNDAASDITFNNFELNTSGNDADGVNADNTSTDGFLRLNDISIAVTGTGDGVDLDQTIDEDFQVLVNGIEIETTSGTGLLASGSNLFVGNGSEIDANTITTDSGTAVDLTDVTTNGGITLESVTVEGTSGSPTVAVSLDNVGDGPITIGPNSGVDGEGGTLNATGTAVSLIDVDDFTMSDVEIASSGSPAIFVENTDTTDQTASDITLNNIQTPAGINTALEVSEDLDAGAISVTVTDSDFGSTAGDTVVVEGTTGTISISDTNVDNSGATALSFTDVEGDINIDTVSADNSVGDAVTFANVDGDVDVNTLTIEDGAARGIVISDGGEESEGDFNFDDETTITNVAGDAFVVTGGTGNIIYDGDITNQTAQSISISNRTEGTVSFGPTAEIIDNGDGIAVTDNTGGTYNLLGDHTLSTGASNAVEVTDNSDVDVSFSDLNITTTTGTGFNVEGNATGTTTVAVSGTTSTITTDGGIGINIEEATIDNTGVTFASVNINSKATSSAIIIQDTEGGSVAVNGGTIADSTNTAIIATDASGLIIDGITVTDSDAGAIAADNVDILTVNNVTVANAGTDAISATNLGTMIMNGTTVSATNANALVLTNNDATNMDVIIDDFTVTAATGAAINAAHSGSGRFDLQLDNSDLEEQVAINASGSGHFDLFSTNTTINDTEGDVGFVLNMNTNMQEADISLVNLDITTADASAFDLDASGNNLNIAFQLSGDSNLISASTDDTFNGVIGTTTQFDATIINNTFNNGSADANTNPFEMITNSSSGTVQMTFSGNTLGGGDLELTNTAGDFEVDNFATLSNDNNTATVSDTGTIVEFDELSDTIETPVAND